MFKATPFLPRLPPAGVKRLTASSTQHLLPDSFTCADSHYSSAERRARELFEAGEFIEAFLDAAIETCETVTPRPLSEARGPAAAFHGHRFASAEAAAEQTLLLILARRGERG